MTKVLLFFLPLFFIRTIEFISFVSLHDMLNEVFSRDIYIK